MIEIHPIQEFCAEHFSRSLLRFDKMLLQNGAILHKAARITSPQLSA